MKLTNGLLQYDVRHREVWVSFEAEVEPFVILTHDVVDQENFADPLHVCCLTCFVERVINDRLFLTLQDVDHAPRTVTTMPGTGMAGNPINVILFRSRHVGRFEGPEGTVARILFLYADFSWIP